jgi:hypothetical protein
LSNFPNVPAAPKSLKYKVCVQFGTQVLVLESASTLAEAAELVRTSRFVDAFLSGS